MEFWNGPSDVTAGRFLTAPFCTNASKTALRPAHRPAFSVATLPAAPNRENTNFRSHPKDHDHHRRPLPPDNTPQTPAKMITRFITEVKTRFNPFSAQAKSARLFLSFLPPTARAQGMAITTQLLPRASAEPSSLHIKFSTLLGTFSFRRVWGRRGGSWFLGDGGKGWMELGEDGQADGIYRMRIGSIWLTFCVCEQRTARR